MACELLLFTVHATLWVCITWNSSSNCRVHAAAVLHFNATGLATQTGPCSLTYKECFFSQWIPFDDVAPQRDDRDDVLSFKVPWRQTARLVHSRDCLAPVLTMPISPLTSNTLTILQMKQEVQLASHFLEISLRSHRNPLVRMVVIGLSHHQETCLGDWSDWLWGSNEVRRGGGLWINFEGWAIVVGPPVLFAQNTWMSACS